MYPRAKVLYNYSKNLWYLFGSENMGQLSKEELLFLMNSNDSKAIKKKKIIAGRTFLFLVMLACGFIFFVLKRGLFAKII